MLANNFQKPTYRKIKPNQSRRIISSIRTVNPTVPAAIQPSQVLSSRLSSPTSTSFIEVPNYFGNHSPLYPRLQSNAENPIPIGDRVIQHANRQILPKNRNHFNVQPFNGQFTPAHYESIGNYPLNNNNEFDHFNNNPIQSVRHDNTANLYQTTPLLSDSEPSTTKVNEFKSKFDLF